MPPLATLPGRRRNNQNPYAAPVLGAGIDAHPMPANFAPSATPLGGATSAAPAPAPVNLTGTAGTAAPAGGPAASSTPSWFQPLNATGPYASTINQFTDASNRANQANEDRYNQTLATLEGQGQSAKNDIARSGQNERGDITQDAIGRGIYSTSVLDALRGQSQEREQRSTAGVNEAVANQRAGIMQSRTDQGPNAALYANLINQQAAGAAGSQRSTNTIGAQTGNGGAPFGSNPYADLMGGGGGRGGGGAGGGSSGQGSSGPTFGRGGGGGSGGYSGNPYGFGTPPGNNPGSQYSGVTGFARDTPQYNPDGSQMIDTHYNPAGGSNIYLGSNGSVTGGGRPPRNASSTIAPAIGSGGNEEWPTQGWAESDEHFAQRLEAWQSAHSEG